MAVLVLGPGCNGSAESWILQQKWRDFAREHHLGLVGLSFASDVKLLTGNNRGYYYASQGSGQLLLDAIDRIYHEPLPLVLFGISGGAHFTSRFVEWKPERVWAWCAYSAAWWDKPAKAEVTPPGLIACGDQDPRYGASLSYFKQGRALGKPWLWLSVPHVGHAVSASAENFVLHYLEAALRERFAPAPSGEWVDVDRKTTATAETVKSIPSVTGWLPEADLMPEWNQVHQP